MDRPDDAERWALDFVQYSEGLAKQAPGNVAHRFGLISSKVCLFRVLDRLKRWRDSPRDVAEFMQDAEKLIADDPDDYGRQIGDSLWDLFIVLTTSADPKVRDPIRAAHLAVTAFERAQFRFRYRDCFSRMCFCDHCNWQEVVSALGECKQFDRHARPGALLWLAIAHSRLDQSERAMDSLERAITACEEAKTWMRENPQDVDDQMRDCPGAVAELVEEVPATLVANGNEREARLAMEKCIAWRRRLAERDGATYLDFSRLAWTLAGGPVAALREPKEAIQWAEKALSLSPESRTARQALGVARYRLGEFAEAAKQFDLLAELVAKKGTDPRLIGYFFPALTLWQLGHHEQARASFVQAKETLANYRLATTQLMLSEAESILSVSQEAAGKTAKQPSESDNNSR